MNMCIFIKTFTTLVYLRKKYKVEQVLFLEIMYKIAFGIFEQIDQLLNKVCYP